MGNSLGRIIEEGEAVVLKKQGHRKFVVTAGFGRYDFTSGCAIWGHFEDTPHVEVGPIDAYMIDKEATEKLNTKE